MRMTRHHYHHHHHGVYHQMHNVKPAPPDGMEIKSSWLESGLTRWVLGSLVTTLVWEWLLAWIKSLCIFQWFIFLTQCKFEPPRNPSGGYECDSFSGSHTVLFRTFFTQRQSTIKYTRPQKNIFPNIKTIIGKYNNETLNFSKKIKRQQKYTYSSAANLNPAD